jgi:hypothetical protein
MAPTTYTVTSRGTPITFVSAFETTDAAAAYVAKSGLPFRSDFANSLLQAHDERRLSKAQAAWINKLATDEKAKADSQDSIAALSLSSLVSLFATAYAAGKKFPKISLPCITSGSGRVKLSRAGERSAHPGSIQITDGGAYGSNVWFGRINADGSLTAGAAFPQVKALVEALAANPAAAGAQHGLATGECVFCGLALTTAESRSVGYGPVCAEKWGLPWGDTSVADAADSAAKATVVEQAQAAPAAAPAEPFVGQHIDVAARGDAFGIGPIGSTFRYEWFATLAQANDAAAHLEGVVARSKAEATEAAAAKLSAPETLVDPSKRLGWEQLIHNSYHDEGSRRRHHGD